MYGTMNEKMIHYLFIANCRFTMETITRWRAICQCQQHEGILHNPANPISTHSTNRSKKQSYVKTIKTCQTTEFSVWYLVQFDYSCAIWEQLALNFIMCYIQKRNPHYSKNVSRKPFHKFTILLPQETNIRLEKWKYFYDSIGDLWGPLILCTFMATVLQGSSDAQNDGGPEFAQVFVIVWIGAMIVTLNSKLLGGNM